MGKSGFFSKTHGKSVVIITSKSVVIPQSWTNIAYEQKKMRNVTFDFYSTGEETCTQTNDYQILPFALFSSKFFLHFPNKHGVLALR